MGNRKFGEISNVLDSKCIFVAKPQISAPQGSERNGRATSFNVDFVALFLYSYTNKSNKYMKGLVHYAQKDPHQKKARAVRASN